MSNVCHSFGLKAKEHNSDYLSDEEIIKRIESGVDSLNIAPEMGVIETSVILNRLKKNESLRNDFFNLCYSSGKWRKWVDKEPDPETIAKICGHYTFGSKEFQLIKSKLGKNIDEEILNNLFFKYTEVS